MKTQRACSLQAKHAAAENSTWGIDGEKGTLVDIAELGIWEPYCVKVQTIKTSIEVRTNVNYQTTKSKQQNDAPAYVLCP